MIWQVEKSSKVILSEPFKDIKEPKQKKAKKKPKDKTAKETEVKNHNSQLHGYFSILKIDIFIYNCYIHIEIHGNKCMPTISDL